MRPVRQSAKASGATCSIGDAVTSATLLGWFFNAFNVTNRVVCKPRPGLTVFILVRWSHSSDRVLERPVDSAS